MKIVKQICKWNTGISVILLFTDRKRAEDNHEDI